jgi:hypothetical protein
MINKFLAIVSISAVFCAQAQNVSVIENTANIYSNTNLSGSAKYNAMAGSMGALGGDVSTLNSNPAGLGVYITNDAFATLSVNTGKNTTTFAGSARNYSLNHTDLLAGAVVTFATDNTSAWKMVNFGINYSSKSIEDYTETGGNSALVMNDPALGNSYTFLRHAYDRTGNQAKTNFGIGANYDNKIYIGAGLNFHYASITQYDTAEFQEAITTSSGTTTAVEDFSKQYTPFSEQSNGFSANIGIIGKINDQFRLGAALETPVWWTINRIYNYYNDASAQDGTASEDRKLSTPMKATLSAAFVPDKSFAVKIDYSIELTKPKYQVYGDAESELNSFFSSNYKNVSEIRAGAEYRIQSFRIRAGYAMATSPFKSISLDSYNDAGIVGNTAYSNLFGGQRNTIAAGIGYDFKSFYLDATYQNVSSKYNNPFLKGSSDTNSNYFSYNYILPTTASAVSNVKNTQNNFFVTVGWKF